MSCMASIPAARGGGSVVSIRSLVCPTNREHLLTGIGLTSKWPRRKLPSRFARMVWIAYQELIHQLMRSRAPVSLVVEAPEPGGRRPGPAVSSGLAIGEP